MAGKIQQCTQATSSVKHRSTFCPIRAKEILTPELLYLSTKIFYYNGVENINFGLIQITVYYFTNPSCTDRVRDFSHVKQRSHKPQVQPGPE